MKEFSQSFPLISVIIPVYNRDQTVARAIYSAISQTYKNIEIIIVDDFSTDNTKKIIKDIPDSRITVISHEENLGAAAARNSGIRNSEGEYLAFLDSDDEWLPEKLQNQIAKIINSNDEIGGCITGKYLVENGNLFMHNSKNYGSWRKRLLFVCDIGPGTTLLVKNNVFNKVGFFDESLRRYEDWDWLIRLTKYFDLISIEEPLAYVYRETYMDAKTLEEVSIRQIEKHQAEIHQFGWLIAQKIKARRYQDIAWHYHLARQDSNDGTTDKKVRYYYGKTITNFPFQRPGVYLAWIDSVFGTSLRDWFAKNIWNKVRH